MLQRPFLGSHLGFLQRKMCNSAAAKAIFGGRDEEAGRGGGKQEERKEGEGGGNGTPLGEQPSTPTQTGHVHLTSQCSSCSTPG